MPLQIKAFGLSVVGAVRNRNEDTLAVVPSRGLVVVADGMGGAPKGDVASALAVQEVVRGSAAGEGMVEGVKRANRKIRELSESQPSFEGMGTTVTALRVLPEVGTFEVAHVGDSRAYRLSGEEFVALTRDHTMVRDLVDAGKLPPEAERGHPMSHILSRAVGTEEVLEVDRVAGQVAPGDRFLLCSDGLVKVMRDEEIEASLREARADLLDVVVRSMVDEGLRRGAPDNITVALLAVEAPLRPR